MFLPKKEIEAVTSRLNGARGTDIDIANVLTIVQAHPRPRKFALKLIAILQAEATEAYRNPDHQAETLPIKMKLDGDDIAAAEAVLGLFCGREDYTSLGAVALDDVRLAEQTLRQDGVLVLDQPLGADCVEALINLLRAPDVEFAEKGTGVIHKGYDPVRAEQAAANTVWLVDQDRLNRERLIQQLAFDPYILSVAQAYLGAPPIHVQTNAWWSLNCASDDKALAASAQKYHQDKEFVKFIKLFVYLTDVGADNGPHQYIKGSIRDYKKALPRRGKAGKRYDTDFIERKFGKDRVLTMTGQAGTMILEDTHGLHRGVPVRSGHRLLLQFEYANSLFCSPVQRFKGQGVAAWEGHKAALPRLFANYD